MGSFEVDLAKAKKTELLVIDILNRTTIDYGFEWVGDIEAYRHKGDIKVLDIRDEEHFIEVKDDSVIATSGNVLCEEAVYSYLTQKWYPGNMQYDYETYAVVSRQINTIYFIDFDILKNNYTKGRQFEKTHITDDGYPSQTTRGRLCSLEQIRKWNGLLYIIEYDDNHKTKQIEKIA